MSVGGAYLWCIYQPVFALNLTVIMHVSTSFYIIIIIIITTTMFVVLSSWHSHCESSPDSFDECRLSAGWPPTLRPNNRFGLWVRRKIGCYYPQTPSSIQGVYSRKSRRKTQYLLKFRIWALQWLIMVIMADGPLIRHIMSTRWPVNKKKQF